MNRTSILKYVAPLTYLASLALLPGVWPDGAARAGEPAAADTTLSFIGTVRDDTLYVDRPRVIAAALERNEMLAASGALRDAAAAEAQGAWRAFLPQVQLGEFFLRSDDALMSFGYKLQNRVVTMADFNPALLNAPGETNNYITRIQLLQPIFNGGMGLGGKKAANAMSRAAEYDHRRAAETIRYQAIQAFEGSRLAQAYLRVMDAAVSSASGHVHRAESMVRNEMATEADLLQARVFLNALQQKRIEVRNMVAIAGENIKLLTALTTDLPVVAEAKGEPELTAPVAPAPDAVLSRHDLLARREEAAAAGDMVTVARGAMLPHVNLSLQRDYYSREDLFGDDARSWTLGVYATWDVFKGLQNIGEMKKAKARSRAASHRVDFETRHARVEATQASLAVEAAHDRVLVAREAVTAAREGLRIVTNQYTEGLATMVDLLDVQAAATSAEGNLVQALHDYAVGRANLEYTGAVAPTEPTAAATDTTTAGGR